MSDEYFLQINICTALVDELIKQTSAMNTLYVGKSEDGFNFGLFENIEIDFTTIVETPSKIIAESSSDFIVGDFGSVSLATHEDTQVKPVLIPNYWLEIIEVANHLHEEGIGVFIIDHSFLYENNINRLEKLLNQKDLYISALFDPSEILAFTDNKHTPIFIVITRWKPRQIFVAELLNENQTRDVVDTFFSSETSQTLKDGLFIDLHNFSSFHLMKILEQINRLSSQYSEYTKATLGELSTSITLGKKGEMFLDGTNTIYIPRVGNSPVCFKISDIKIEPQNIYQVELKESVNNKYIASFFKSTLGKLILESATTQGIIPHRNKVNINKALVYLPPHEEQLTIVNTQDLLFRLKTEIDEFDKELALNPKSAYSIVSQLTNMYQAIRELTEIDLVYQKIREGESNKTEFKATLSMDVKTLKKEDYILTSSLKTVVAFLNTEGGDLLIGISDDGNISGINIELTKWHKNSIDKYKLYFKDKLKTRIGEENIPLLDYKVIKIQEKMVFWVKCRPSPTPCFLDKSDFYVRTNPASEVLVGPKLAAYLRSHFT